MKERPFAPEGHKSLTFDQAGQDALPPFIKERMRRDMKLAMDNYINKQLSLVKEWHLAFGVPVLESPTIPDLERQTLRVNLIKEEAQEFHDETMNHFTEQIDIKSVAKGLADILYVVYGTVLEFGMEDVFDKVFSEVHRSNMSKLGDDGKPVKREDGKVLKGPNYSPVNLSFLKSK